MKKLIQTLLAVVFISALFTSQAHANITLDVMAKDVNKIGGVIKTSWTSSGIDENTKLGLLLTSAEKGIGYFIKRELSLTGSYDWVIPNTVASAKDYQLSLSTNDKGPSDVSEYSTPFEIMGSKDTPLIKDISSKVVFEKEKKNKGLILIKYETQGNIKSAQLKMNISCLEGVIVSGEKGIECNEWITLGENKSGTLPIKFENSTNLEQTISFTFDVTNNEGIDTQRVFEIVKIKGLTGANSISTCSFTRNLTLGSTGDDVSNLQYFLQQKGFLGTIGEDKGYFGALTKSALAAYQASIGISPAEGYFGPTTRIKISSECDGSSQTNTSMIKVLSPNGGEKIEAGEKYTIKWSGFKSNGNVRINLNFSPIGYTYNNVQDAISFDAPDTGSFVWIPSEFYLKGIEEGSFNVSIERGDSSDASDNNFKIIEMNCEKSWSKLQKRNSCDYPKRLSITSPKGGEKFTPGQVISVDWEKSSLGGAVGVIILNKNKPNFAKWDYLSYENGYKLKVPEDLPVGEYFLQVAFSKDETRGEYGNTRGIIGYSNSFAVVSNTSPSLNINAPEKIKVGSNAEVKVTGLKSIKNVPDNSTVKIMLDDNYVLASKDFPSSRRGGSTVDFEFVVPTSVNGLASIAPKQLVSGEYNIKAIIHTPPSGTPINVGDPGTIVASSENEKVNIVSPLPVPVTVTPPPLTPPPTPPTIVNAYTLTTSGSNGTITRSPNKTSYNAGEVVTLTATPNSGYQFEGWVGVCSGTNTTCTVTMSSSKTVGATFNTVPVNTYTLTTSATNGTVTRSPSQTSYTSGTSVTLTAAPNTGYQFSSWTGCTSSTNTCTVTMNANKTVSATFSVAPTSVTIYSLTTSASNGTITRSPNQTFYGQGTSVTLTAAPNTGYQFSSWTGCTSSTNTCTVTMNANKTVSASFSIMPVVTVTPTLTLTSPNGGGTYKAGDTINLQWTSTGLTTEKIIVSLISGSTYNQYMGSTDNDGNHSITIPSTTPAGSYKIFISTNGTAVSKYDQSDTTFEIQSSVVAVTPTLTLTSPNGGGTYKAGDTINLQWTSTGLTTEKIIVSLISGSTYNQYMGSTDNDGNHSITIPSTTPAGSYKIFISTNGTAVSKYDQSDGTFQVTSTNTTISLINNSNMYSSNTNNYNIDLELGMAHPTVIDLQKYLNSNGYIIETISGQPGSVGYETNYFGEKTKQALIKFQKDKNIVPASGFYGPQTRRAMGV